MRKVHWQEVDGHTKVVIALRHCEVWLSAVERQVQRVSEPQELRQREIDLQLFLVVVRRYERAAKMMLDVLRDPALAVAYRVMHDEELVDLRDMTEHFDDYIRGKGNKQPDDDAHGFLALVEFKDPVMAYGQRSVKLSHVHLAVQVFHRELVAALERFAALERLAPPERL